MGRPLRSLSGLIDFNSAARWGSFKRAAEELHKTPAAISQQIKTLEEELGFPLFVRQTRQVQLTEKGAEFAATVSQVLTELRDKCAALQEDEDAALLRISCTHSFAYKWLVPRMPRFTRLHPELDIRVDSNDRQVNLDAGGIDVAIRHGPFQPGDPDLIFSERLVAVYSPGLLPPGRDSLELDDLPLLPLLCEGDSELWMRFMQANGVRNPRLQFARSFSHSGLLAQAAAAGQGVAVVAFAMVHEDVRNGVLRLLRARSAPYASGYRFLTARGKEAAPRIRRLREWLEEEMAAMGVMLSEWDAAQG
ncbi:LysR substrate-binding domain-containing protein [Pseudoduganella violacea]|uniref:LysR family glycine cleavage system transcriptional activator n=1 Tax=Pseudoduganella violacea TaxID=1715466 RepID=A0A7W5BBL8_9BURK|nr:LysR substrate-binding domain-containing protein [Pseudoduganella violacea]MBB3120133.1 LysR family glycine cleavage system transcriptional activator [Pseudoduganella violacea]